MGPGRSVDNGFRSTRSQRVPGRPEERRAPIRSRPAPTPLALTPTGQVRTYKPKGTFLPRSRGFDTTVRTSCHVTAGGGHYGGPLRTDLKGQ